MIMSWNRIQKKTCGRNFETLFSILIWPKTWTVEVSPYRSADVLGPGHPRDTAGYQYLGLVTKSRIRKLFCNQPFQGYKSIWFSILILILILQFSKTQYWYWYWYCNFWKFNIDMDIDIARAIYCAIYWQYIAQSIYCWYWKFSIKMDLEYIFW